MATKRISALTAAGSAALTDQIPIENASNATRKLTLTQVFALAASQPWSWSGTHAFGDSVTMAQTLAVTGAVALASTLTAGATTLASLGVTGDVAVNTNRFNVTASNGNTAIAGTLGVTGAVSLASTLAAGATTLASLGVTGAATVGTTLGVTGVSTFGVAPSGVAAHTAAARGTFTGTATAFYAGLAGEAVGNPASNPTSDYIGVYGRSEVLAGNIRTIPRIAAMRAFASHGGTGTLSGAFGLRVDPFTNTGGGTITNTYGLYLDDQTAATNNYGVYQVGANVVNYLAGSLGVGNTSPYGKVSTLSSASPQLEFGRTTGTGYLFGDASSTILSYRTGYDGTNYISRSTGAQAFLRIDATGLEGWTVASGSTVGATVTPTQTFDLAATGMWMIAAQDAFSSSSVGISTKPTYTNTNNFRVGVAGQSVGNPSGTSTAAYIGLAGVADTAADNAQDLTSSVAGLRGFYGRVRHLGSGVVTAAAGILVDSSVNSGGGTITNLYGLYIAAQTAGVNNWGVYQVGTTTPNFFAGPIRMGTTGGPLWQTGSGSPEGAVTAPVGSLYTRTDGGASTTLYVKESGTGDTGWIAK
jgi:hypothetical protein